jgi:general secretion pathway protein I
MNPTILKHAPAKGFSLIEVLIALALFAIASNIIGSAFINALLSRERNNDNSYRDIAIQTARKQLLLEKNIDDAEDGGSVETLELGEVDWYAEIIPTDMVDLFEVNLFIEFFDVKDDQSSNYNETLLLLRPTWSESDERSSLLQDKKEDLLDIRASELFD